MKIQKSLLQAPKMAKLALAVSLACIAVAGPVHADVTAAQIAKPPTPEVRSDGQSRNAELVQSLRATVNSMVDLDAQAKACGQDVTGDSLNQYALTELCKEKINNMKIEVIKMSNEFVSQLSEAVVEKSVEYKGDLEQLGESRLAVEALQAEYADKTKLQYQQVDALEAKFKKGEITKSKASAELRKIEATIRSQAMSQSHLKATAGNLDQREAYVVAKLRSSESVLEELDFKRHVNDLALERYSVSVSIPLPETRTDSDFLVGVLDVLGGDSAMFGDTPPTQFDCGSDCDVLITEEAGEDIGEIVARIRRMAQGEQS